MRIATAFIAAVLLLAALPSKAVSQTLGDEFIFFVNGSNVMVPTIDAVPVDDPLDPGSGNKVARINSGAWTHAGWSWGRNEGIDATANGEAVKVTGLAAQTNVTGGDPTDRLRVSTFAGDDRVMVADDARALLDIQVDLGADQQ